ncbi:MAG: hypothetical protein PGN26_11580 [Xylophilus ampelinus]
MATFPSDVRMGADQPFLQNAQGWKFFLHAVEIPPGRWRGVVGIHAGPTGLTGRLHCIQSRSAEGEALQGAKDFAWRVFRQIEARLGAGPRPEAPVRDAAAARRACH